MRFRVDLKIFLFILIFLLTRQIEIYLLMIAFALIHELGHLICGLALGMKPEKMEINPCGVSIAFKLNLKDYNEKLIKGNLFEIKKIIIAIAGPVVNLIIILITLNCNMNIFLGIKIIYINLILFLFNLLPFYPLDGGRILKSLLHIFLGKIKSETYIDKISFIVLIILTMISSIIIFYIKNIAIFIIIIFLWILYLKENLIYRRRIKIYNLIKSIEIKEN